LEEHRILLSLQETDLERLEEKLTEEQACGLHSYDGQDLSARLEELRVRMVGVKDERADEVVGLSRLVMGIAVGFVDLGGVSHPGYPPVSEVSSGGLGGSRSHSGASMRGRCLRRWSLSPNMARPPPPRPQAILLIVFSFAFGVAVMYIFIYIYTLH
jgi:hypothetical protein